MQKHTGRSRLEGVTLIEVLVMLLLVTLLAAAVFPVVTRRVSRGEPLRASEHLRTIRVGIEGFSRDLQEGYPGDMEDLIAHVTAADMAIRRQGESAVFDAADLGRWSGPYVDASVIGGGALVTGFGVPIRDDFIRFDATNDAPYGVPRFSTNGTMLFVAVQIGSPGTQLSASQFEAINDLVDGAGEPDGPGPNTSWTMGRLRFSNSLVAADTVAYFLATPVQ